MANLDESTKNLRARGWVEANRIEFSPGPCCTYRDPAGNALVIYENKRPFVMQEFKGKIDSVSP